MNLDVLSYAEYHGHRVEYLRKLLPALREQTDRLIWTAGDSSLDNKYWFSDTAPAVEGAYHDTLRPQRSKQDITYWLNYLLHEEDQKRQQESSTANYDASYRKTAAINTAVEATTLNERTYRLRPQDVFIRDNIREDDILIVSVGGNDAVLLPLPCTIAAIGGLMCMPTDCVENGCSCGAVPVDDYCCGCGPSLCSCLCAFPPCLGYTRHLYGVRVEKYLESLTSKTKPAKILVCMIYYPDEANTPSWSGLALGALQYNRNPSKIQTLIRKIYQTSSSTIRIPGTPVIPVPLFHALDGKNTEDYVQRVEPSASGGRKMAELLLDAINQQPTTSSSYITESTPTASYIRDRG